MQTKTTSWGHLPLEIRLMILEMLALDPSSDNTSSSKKTHLAKYATVSKEWQPIFERRNFYQLTLGSSCLKDFEKIVHGQKRKLVKHIWLRIRLRPYDCPDCMILEGEPILVVNNAIIAKAICNLSSILGTWEQNEERSGKGIALEISADSISDSQHACKEHHFETNAYNPESIDEHHESSNFHDPPNGWVNGWRVATPGVK